LKAGTLAACHTALSKGRFMIRILAGLAGLATLGFAVGAAMGPVPFYLPIGALILTAVLFASAKLPIVIRFLIGLFAVSFLVLGAMTAAHEAGLTPPSVEAFLPPPQASIVAALLALINYIICYIPVVRRIIDMANPFFESNDRDRLELGYLGYWHVTERTLGLGLLGIIIALNVIQVYLLVLFNFWNNRFYTALQDKNEASLW
jgi:putative ATP-binding cassette transporter